MKHIISLSMKYIRRQKMRTVLTFLCVTLSVFILCSFGAYMGSTLQTLQNQCRREGGSAEADLMSWFAQLNDDEIERAVDVLQNHIVVSDYFTYSESIIEDYKGISLGERSEENSSILTYMEFDDGNEIRRINRVYEMAFMGNEELKPKGSFNAEWKSDLQKNEGSILPYWVQDMGYSAGDTLTFTIRPVIAEIDEDDEVMKEVRRKLLDEFGTSVIWGEPECYELDLEIQNSMPKNGLSGSFEHYDLTFDDVPLKNIEYGKPVEVSIKIAGFHTDASSTALTVINSDIDSFFNKELVEKNSDDLTYWYTASADVRINEKVDFDDAMEMLYENLGFPKGNYYADLPRLNYELLFLEFRSAGSLVEGFPTIIIMFVLIFFAWLAARFVIDNAFEISNKERSSQFAVLRIMGASKPQITALVFTEALFYTLTAVPIGTVSAYLLCKSSFTALRNMGFQDFEYKANVYFAAGGIILCISAIFISAYTSAIWASRKLSPAEALNYGKPKKKKEKTRRRKSKINLSSKQFIRRYTSKNIARSKGRYIISTITMAFGTMFFTFSLMLGLFMYSNMDKIVDNDDLCDFRISGISVNMFNKAEETFGSKELFKKYEIRDSSSNYSEGLYKVDKEKLEELFPYKMNLHDILMVRCITRSDFDKYIAEISGMTYDEFLQSGAAVYNISCYGTNIVWDENGGLVRQYEDSYQETDIPLVIFDDVKVNIIGIACSEFRPIPCLIIPIEGDIAEKLGMVFSIEAAVNGQENYIEAEKVYNEFAAESNPMFYENYYMTNTGLSEFIKALAKIAVTFISAVWLVGILSMVNSINTSVLNRSRELMMLRSVGMSRKQLRRMVLIESFMYSALSSSIGIIIAVGAFFLLMNILHIHVIFLVSMAVGLLVSIGLNIIIAILASIPASKNLEKAENLIRTY